MPFRYRPLAFHAIGCTPPARVPLRRLDPAQVNNTLERTRTATEVPSTTLPSACRAAKTQSQGSVRLKGERAVCHLSTSSDLYGPVVRQQRMTTAAVCAISCTAARLPRVFSHGPLSSPPDAAPGRRPNAQVRPQCPCAPRSRSLHLHLITGL